MSRFLLKDLADVALAAVVATIVGLLIVPLPPWLLDTLLALDLALGAALLIAALQARDPLSLAAFPSLLLLATLFRLALNVGSTRLALIEGHAGAVIQAFGEFAIQGEYVVGAVIFAILTLVQFLVVAKGAERVAEVGARFTLDAMPGKQMAIDADLRSGAIDMACARGRRRALEREGQLYGAMDGAMKFVKGDAIAGVLIVLVNALGGLVIGVLFRGMTLAEAAQTYALLAIGDGLVSQIPALCIALSAGIVVTRVAAENEESTLASEIARQLAATPRTWEVVAVLLCLVGLVPMMPMLPFFGLAALAALGARTLRRRAARSGSSAKNPEGPAGRDTAGASPAGAPLPAGIVPIRIDLDRTLDPLLASDGERLSADLSTLAELLFLETGVRFPHVVLQRGARLGEGAYQILVEEVPCARGHLVPGGTYALAPASEVAFLGLPLQPAEDGESGRSIVRIPAAATERVRSVGIPVRTATEQLLAHLAAVLRRRAAAFLGVQEVQDLLDALEKSHPALVREAGQRVSPPLLADVLRRLVEEGLSVRNLRAILEAMVEPGTEPEASALTERCRRALRRHLAHRYAGDGTLYAHLTDPELEALLREAVRLDPQAGPLALAPEDAQAILEGVRQALGETREGVILAAPDVRRHLRKLCEGSFPGVAVLAYSELTPDLHVRPVGRIAAARVTA